MERFKAYRLTETPDKKIRAEFVDTTLDQLDPGDVTVRVAYSSVNYKDALAATGKGKILRRPSCIGGIDFSGTVLSSSDPRFKKGDAVLTTSGEYVGVSHDGGYSPYARVKGDWLTKLPPGLSLWEAMAFGTAGYTAGIAVRRMEHNGLAPPKGSAGASGVTVRGASLLGINSGDSSNDIRDRVWQRLATDLKPPLLKEMARTIPFSELPRVFDDFINAKVSRRVVVDLAE